MRLRLVRVGSILLVCEEKWWSGRDLGQRKRCDIILSAWAQSPASSKRGKYGLSSLYIGYHYDFHIFRNSTIYKEVWAEKIRTTVNALRHHFAGWSETPGIYLEREHQNWLNCHNLPISRSDRIDLMYQFQKGGWNGESCYHKIKVY